MPGIPREHIDDVWDMAEPMIKKATDRMPGGYQLKDLKSDCLDGSLVLWMGRNAKCALLIKVSQYHLFKSCVIILIGGEDYNSWIKELKEIEEYAMSQDCKNMVISGRRGWEKILKEYKFDSVTVTKEL